MYMIEWFVVNVLWMRIISYLWVQVRARLGGTQLNFKSLGQLFQQDKALGNLTTARVLPTRIGIMGTTQIGLRQHEHGVPI
jgi:hypothetical protein